MQLSTLRIKNFRRLVDVRVDLDKDISIFVGSNNSGKTSVAQALQVFLSGDKKSVLFHDISACRWSIVQAFEKCEEGATLPAMTMDLWFKIDDADVHRVIDLLPNLDWKETYVGVRIVFATT